MKINITLNLTPKPLPRARHTVRGSHATSYYTRKTKDTFELYESEITREFGELSKEQRLYIINAIKQPKGIIIGLKVTFYMPIPKMSKIKRLRTIDTPHYKKPDLDNLLKMILDRAEGILFYNDNCIHDIRAKKIYSDRPRIELELEYKEVIK